MRQGKTCTTVTTMLTWDPPRSPVICQHPARPNSRTLGVNPRGPYSDTVPTLERSRRWNEREQPDRTRADQLSEPGPERSGTSQTSSPSDRQRRFGRQRVASAGAAGPPDLRRSPTPDARSSTPTRSSSEPLVAPQRFLDCSPGKSQRSPWTTSQRGEERYTLSFRSRRVRRHPRDRDVPSRLRVTRRRHRSRALRYRPKLARSHRPWRHLFAHSRGGRIVSNTD